jgi:hypothetical protein
MLFHQMLAMQEDNFVLHTHGNSLQKRAEAIISQEILKKSEGQAAVQERVYLFGVKTVLCEPHQSSFSESESLTFSGWPAPVRTGVAGRTRMGI